MANIASMEAAGEMDLVHRGVGMLAGSGEIRTESTNRQHATTGTDHLACD